MKNGGPCQTAHLRYHQHSALLKHYLQILNVVEQNEPAAEALSIVINKDQGGPGELVPVWDPSGSFKAIKLPSEVPMPKDSEELRQRVELLGVAWMCVSNVHSSWPWLEGQTPQLYAEYLRYLLG